MHADGKLVPKSAKANAIFEQAVCIEQADFDPYAFGVVRERVFTPLFGGTTDEKVASEKQVQLESKLDAYESILAKHKYLGGNVRFLMAGCFF